MEKGTHSGKFPGGLVGKLPKAGSGQSGTPRIKDSGVRQEFGTGAVRDMSKGKGRCDLMPLRVIASLMLIENPDRVDISAVLKYMDAYIYEGEPNVLHLAANQFIFKENFEIHQILIELSKYYEQGIEKYGERNWEKGIPLHSYIDSAVRHLLKHEEGQTDERHDLAFLWNIFGAIWSHENLPEMIDLPFAQKGEKDE